MNNLKYLQLAAMCIITPFLAKAQSTEYKEQYRPQVHFSPAEHWTNDPNGMVFYKGIYHLFFQYYPDGTTWGPMHWGHAASKDLVHWQQQPTALFPDSLGYIFSGSAVVDSNNTSGFGKDGRIPLVAIFTHHDPMGEKQGHDNFQNESLAYSLDEGKTWVKYAGNPVLHNPGIRDFRDPKVMWYAPLKKWVMTLATKDRVTFYASSDLKNWTRQSDFGAEAGAHGGVWECPDLFLLSLNGKTYWVLLVSINPGGPNHGSATQYFIGQFDGEKFKALSTETRWVDYGPDDYAGITWFNTGARKIFLGWMSNWDYANQVPTSPWRNAMTIPRELSLKNSAGQILLASKPVAELNRLNDKIIVFNAGAFNGENLLNAAAKLPVQYRLKISFDKLNDFTITLTNKTGDKVIVGYSHSKGSYYIDRSNAGQKAFNKDFARVLYAPRFSKQPGSDLELVIDAASVELFADGGLSVMTALVFPNQPYNQLSVQVEKGIVSGSLKLIPLKSIWTAKN
jgi:fructan beta-fructosidase